jgi:hypothetical protein
MPIFKANVSSHETIDSIHRWGKPLEVDPGEIVELPFDPQDPRLVPVDAPAATPEPASGWQASAVIAEPVEDEEVEESVEDTEPK